MESLKGKLCCQLAYLSHPRRSPSPAVQLQPSTLEPGKRSAHLWPLNPEPWLRVIPPKDAFQHTQAAGRIWGPISTRSPFHASVAYCFLKRRAVVFVPDYNSAQTGCISNSHLSQSALIDAVAPSPPPASAHNCPRPIQPSPQILENYTQLPREP